MSPGRAAHPPGPGARPRAARSGEAPVRVQSRAAPRESRARPCVFSRAPAPAPCARPSPAQRGRAPAPALVVAAAALAARAEAGEAGAARGGGGSASRGYRAASEAAEAVAAAAGPARRLRARSVTAAPGREEPSKRSAYSDSHSARSLHARARAKSPLLAASAEPSSLRRLANASGRPPTDAALN
ncbi:skin secretory protein xP2-like [Ursus maritimus]|uniref:Skin secretory protein xP2-like n=1 Tax=Ursus maritimus TaxID=29073 RepID=A0A8M1FGA9_URSMA|nr:skin secretory protein xP2-like [Ursus maritimus]